MQRQEPPWISFRRGSTYVAVMGMSLVIAVLGVGAILAVRLESRAAEGITDLGEARRYAQSAIDLGMFTMGHESDWRTTRPNGAWRTNSPLGQGSFSLSVVDPTDGLLSDSESEPVELTGTGVVGEARYMLQATATARQVPLEALTTCIHAGSNVTVNLLKSIRLTGAPLSMNGSVNGPGTITGNVEAGSVGILPIIVGTSTIPSAAKDLPGAGVFELYKSLATSIAHPGAIDGRVLTASLNPLGATNPDGVYYIDTGGSDLTLKDSRIEGTMVVRCPGRSVLVDQHVLLQPHRPDYPVLIVDGAIRIRLYSETEMLTESIAGINLNPPGAPYNGTTDSDFVDSYPNEVQGLVHATGDVTLERTSRVRGVLIVHANVTVDGSVEVVYDSSLHDHPPLGYVSYVMQLSSGSWRRIVLP